MPGPGRHSATFEQLFTAWEEGLDWCNAGWLADGTVQYPITEPRDGCGGVDLAPGVRSYGQRHRLLARFDAFCFSASIKGQCARVCEHFQPKCFQLVIFDSLVLQELFTT